MIFPGCFWVVNRLWEPNDSKIICESSIFIFWHCPNFVVASDLEHGCELGFLYSDMDLDTCCIPGNGWLFASAK